MTSFAHIAQRLFNVPLAIHPRKAEMVVAALAERMGIASLVRLNGDTVILDKGAFYLDDDDDFGARRETRVDPGYDMIGDTGIAMIQVSGTLVHKLGSLRPWSGMTGYDGLRQAYFSALTDSSVRALMCCYDSGGGEVAGCFDLVDAMHDARGTKPVWAVLDESAYSAAYALASSADRIVVPRTGGTGSIGVICMHVDFSRALNGAGIKVTFVTSEGADRKTDGHGEIPLSEEAYAAFKAEIDEAGRLFDDTVARNRGLTSKAVNALKAGTFMGAHGVRTGLADAVMAPDAAFRALLDELA